MGGGSPLKDMGFQKRRILLIPLARINWIMYNYFFFRPSFGISVLNRQEPPSCQRPCHSRTLNCVCLAVSCLINVKAMNPNIHIANASLIQFSRLSIQHGSNSDPPWWPPLPPPPLSWWLIPFSKAWSQEPGVGRGGAGLRVLTASTWRKKGNIVNVSM